MSTFQGTHWWSMRTLMPPFCVSMNPSWSLRLSLSYRFTSSWKTHRLERWSLLVMQLILHTVCQVFPVKTPSGVAEVAEHPLWESDEPVDISTGVNPYLKVSKLDWNQQDGETHTPRFHFWPSLSPAAWYPSPGPWWFTTAPYATPTRTSITYPWSVFCPHKIFPSSCSVLGGNLVSVPVALLQHHRKGMSPFMQLAIMFLWMLVRY